MRRVVSTVVILLTLLFTTTSTVRAASLYGTEVTAAWYCCEAPTEPYRQTEFASATVSDHVEFSEYAFYWFVNGFVSWGGTIDVQESAILLRSTEEVSGGPPDPFGGIVFFFDSTVSILDVSINPVTNLFPHAVSFTNSTLTLNVSNLQRTPTSVLALDLTVAAIPEPMTSALWTLGLVFLLARRLKRPNSAA